MKVNLYQTGSLSLNEETKLKMLQLILQSSKLTLELNVSRTSVWNILHQV